MLDLEIKSIGLWKGNKCENCSNPKLFCETTGTKTDREINGKEEKEWEGKREKENFFKIFRIKLRKTDHRGHLLRSP